MDSHTVLCIDDRPQELDLRKATLESRGYCVKIASSGHAAMKVLEETSVAVILLEYKLEGMDAQAVASHIKQRFPNLPIILLSAYSEMPENRMVRGCMRDEGGTAGRAGGDHRKSDAPAQVRTTF